MAKQEINIIIAARDRASRVMNQVENRSKRLASTFATMGRFLGPLGLTAGMGVAIAGMKKMVDAASDTEESLNKVREVFGASADAIEDFASRGATAIGASRQQTLAMTGEIGNLLVSFGLAEGEAAKFSERVVQMAADIGSFNNAKTEDVLVAIRAALVGSSEPMLRFGADTRVARLEQVALDIGLEKTGKTLTAQQRAMAAIEAIARDTAKAQGDFARTSDGLANSTKILTGQIGDLSAQLGEALIPAAKAAVDIFSDFVGVFTESEFDRAIQRLIELGADVQFLDQVKQANQLNESLGRRVEIMEEIQAAEERTRAISQQAQEMVGQMALLQNTALDERLEAAIKILKVTGDDAELQQVLVLLREKALDIEKELIVDLTAKQRMDNASREQLRGQVELLQDMSKRAVNLIALSQDRAAIEDLISKLSSQTLGSSEGITRQIEEQNRKLKEQADLIASMPMLPQGEGEIRGLDKSQKAAQDMLNALTESHETRLKMGLLLEDEIELQNEFSNQTASQIVHGNALFRAMSDVSQEIGAAVVFSKDLDQTLSSIVNRLATRALSGLIAGGIASILFPGTGVFTSVFGAVSGFFRHGGRINRPGFAVVGEQGPELVRLPVGAKVHSAPQTEQLGRGLSEAINRLQARDRMSAAQIELMDRRISEAASQMKVTDRVSASAELVSEAISRLPVRDQAPMISQAETMNRREAPRHQPRVVHLTVQGGGERVAFTKREFRQFMRSVGYEVMLQDSALGKGI